jgi:NAD(P)-dependent dehydrogenase (short-subunit alcohol dehydrogenase family)
MLEIKANTPGRGSAVPPRAAWLRKAAESAERVPETACETVRRLTASGAEAIAFLASDDASYITGQILNCGGGVL